MKLSTGVYDHPAIHWHQRVYLVPEFWPGHIPLRFRVVSKIPETPSGGNFMQLGGGFAVDKLKFNRVDYEAVSMQIERLLQKRSAKSLLQTRILALCWTSRGFALVSGDGNLHLESGPAPMIPYCSLLSPIRIIVHDLHRCGSDCH